MNPLRAPPRAGTNDPYAMTRLLGTMPSAGRYGVGAGSGRYWSQMGDPGSVW